MICPRWMPSVRSRCAASLRCLQRLRCVWLHDDGERALLGYDFGVWAQSLSAPGGGSGYDDFAAVDVCPLPLPAPQSLAGSGFLAESGPLHPMVHPADEWAFVECSHNFVVNMASITNERDGGFAPVAPLNDQLVCSLCDDYSMDTHEDADGQAVPGLARCLSVRAARRVTIRTVSAIVTARRAP